MSVHIYVEGGGDQRALTAQCRQGFSEFFKKVLPPGKLKVIACGSRNDTFDRFRTAWNQGKEGFVVLLVDSEAPVEPQTGSWAHLKTRDGWEQPSGATDDHAHDRLCVVLLREA